MILLRASHLLSSLSSHEQVICYAMYHYYAFTTAFFLFSWAEVKVSKIVPPSTFGLLSLLCWVYDTHSIRLEYRLSASYYTLIHDL